MLLNKGRGSCRATPQYKVGDHVTVCLALESRTCSFEPNTEYVIRNVNVTDAGTVLYTIESNGDDITVDEATINIDKPVQKEVATSGDLKWGIINYVLYLLILAGLVAIKYMLVAHV